MADVQDDSVRALISEFLTIVVFILALSNSNDWESWFFDGSLNNWNSLENWSFFDWSREGWSIEGSEECLFCWKNRSGRSDLLDLNRLLNLNLGAAEAASSRAEVLDRSVVTD